MVPRRRGIAPGPMRGWSIFRAHFSRGSEEVEKGVGTIPVPRVVSGRKRSTLCVRVQGSFPLSGFPGRAVAKANDPCHPGMASATATKYPRQSCYSSSQGRCCMELTGPPTLTTAKRLSPGSLARSILPYPVTSAQRRMHDLQNSAGKVRFHRNLMPRLSRWVTQ
jgi:hypothetical protein